VGFGLGDACGRRWGVATHRRGPRTGLAYVAYCGNCGKGLAVKNSMSFSVFIP
jgi:hypothetical protein